jgi:hypothetical protein
MTTAFATELIDLPSQGWYYEPNSSLATGKIEIKYMTAREEDILTSRNLIAKGVVLDKLLEAIIVDKDISINNLLVGDKDGILIAARILGYGKEYPVVIICPICAERNNVSVDLTKLEEKKVVPPPVKGKNELTFTLPNSRHVITYRLVTHEMEQAILAELDGLRKAGVTDVDKTLTTRLKHIIVAVDGDSRGVRDFVDTKFLARDSRAFREEYNKMNPGLDLSFPFLCKKCGAERRMALPLGLDFFWPDSGV